MHPVEIDGRDRTVLSPDSARFPRESRTCTVECASGERATDAWTGVPVTALVEAAGFPDETTHVRVEADDFAAEVPVRPALDGILAFDRRGDRDDREDAGLPRFVANGVSGERLVKRVRRISPVALDPEDEPTVG